MLFYGWIAIQRVNVNKTYRAIHRIEIYPVDGAIHRIEIYPVDGVIQQMALSTLSNDQGQDSIIGNV